MLLFMRGYASIGQSQGVSAGCGRYWLARLTLQPDGLYALTIEPDLIEEVARIVGKSSITPHVTGKYRAGDIRHCFADLALARSKLGYSPQVGFRQGLAEFAEWLKDKVAEDRVDHATAELESRGLVA